MAHHGKTVNPKHEAVHARAKAFAMEMLGPDGTARREREIAALPTIEWKGKTLHTLRCHGTRGKGPHDVHLPEYVLWHLAGLTHYRCVYHTGD